MPLNSADGGYLFFASLSNVGTSQPNLRGHTFKKLAKAI